MCHWRRNVCFRNEALKNHPYHIFGHVAAKNAFRIKNKIHIDTGSAHGHMLTSVCISYKPFMKSQKSEQAVMTEDLQILFHEERKVSLQDLDEDEIRRLHYVSRNKVNFISGTMSPADKDEAAQDLESLRRGLIILRSGALHRLFCNRSIWVHAVIFT